MTHSFRLTAELEVPVHESDSGNHAPKISPLKSLRQKKNISRLRLAQLAHISPYQIEALEERGAGNIL